MSTLKVDGIRSNSASSDAITMADNGTCTANITNNLSNRNIIINGAMQVAQRGTSSSSWSGIGFPACDRQKTLDSYGGTWTISQSTEAPSDNGFTKSTKYDCTTAVTSLNANAYLQHYYRIEGQDLQGVCKGTSNAKPLILSFWVKTNKTGTYNVEAIDQDNSRLCTFAYTVANTNWNKYTVVFPADTTGTFNNDNGVSLDIGWWLVAGSTFNSGSNQNSFGTFVQANRAPSNVNLADSTSNEWYITGIQLEIDHTGSGIATEFEHRSYAQELALCQRYYYLHASGQNQVIGVGVFYQGSNMFTFVKLPVTMRTGPSIDHTTGSNYYQAYYDGGNDGFITFSGSWNVSPTQVGMNTHSGDGFTLGSGGGAAMVKTHSNSAAHLGFSAEL